MKSWVTNLADILSWMFVGRKIHGRHIILLFFHCFSWQILSYVSGYRTDVPWCFPPFDAHVFTLLFFLFLTALSPCSNVGSLRRVDAVTCAPWQSYQSKSWQDNKRQGYRRVVHVKVRRDNSFLSDDVTCLQGVKLMQNKLAHHDLGGGGAFHCQCAFV